MLTRNFALAWIVATALAVGVTSGCSSGGENSAPEAETEQDAATSAEPSEAPADTPESSSTDETAPRPEPEAAREPEKEKAAPSRAESPAPRPAPKPAPLPEPPVDPAPRVAEPDVVQPAPPSEPAEPAPPEIVEVTIPEGTVLELELLTALDSSVNQAGDEVQARTLSPVFVRGEEVLRKGSYVEGRVIQAEAAGRVKGRATLAFTFDRLSTPTGVEKIRTSFVEREAESTRGKDAKTIGGAAGIGAVVGAIVGGKKGAAIGATIGGAGGTGVVLTTKGEELKLPVGTEINVRVDEPVTIQLN